MNDEEKEICRRLHKDPEELFVSKDGKSLYALVNGNFMLFTGDEEFSKISGREFSFHKLTGRQIIEFIVDSLEANAATILDHSHSERPT